MRLSRPLLFTCLLAGALLLPASVAVAQTETSGDILSFRFEDDQAIVEFADRPGEYYILEESVDYLEWQPADASLGHLPLGAVLEPEAPRRFFRVRPYSQFAPLDTDGDGIDDVYELNHPNLNPLDPTDGSKLAPDGGGLTNFQYYQSLFGITSYKLLQRESREVSLFNLGSPSALFEANTREQSIFNFGTPSALFEANSLEVSVYNGQHVPYSDLVQIETREVSVFNFGSPSADFEVITREVSVLNFDEP